MNINTEIARASAIMKQYGVPDHDQLTVVRMLIDAGVEKCLDEQQRLRDEADILTMKAYEGLPN